MITPKKGSAPWRKEGEETNEYNTTLVESVQKNPA